MRLLSLAAIAAIAFGLAGCMSDGQQNTSAGAGGNMAGTSVAEGTEGTGTTTGADAGTGDQ